MIAFRSWVEMVAGNHRAVFVGFNACYDWQFVNWYLETFTGGNPFGFGGIDIKSYFMGMSGEFVVENNIKPTSQGIPAR